MADRADRLQVAGERQHGRCFWCGRAFQQLVPPTTDHLVPRIKGGPSWSENEVAACSRCNSDRGHIAPAEWLLTCESRGWTPDREALAEQLAALAVAIDTRGGQRRARGYVAAQRRRLRNR